jgi:hypothetical protein
LEKKEDKSNNQLLPTSVGRKQTRTSVRKEKRKERKSITPNFSWKGKQTKLQLAKKRKTKPSPPPTSVGEKRRQIQQSITPNFSW